MNDPIAFVAFIFAVAGLFYAFGWMRGASRRVVIPTAPAKGCATEEEGEAYTAGWHDGAAAAAETNGWRELADELDAQADFEEAESVHGGGSQTRELMRRAASALRTRGNAVTQSQAEAEALAALEELEQEALDNGNTRAWSGPLVAKIKAAIGVRGDDNSPSELDIDPLTHPSYGGNAGVPSGCIASGGTSNEVAK